MRTASFSLALLAAANVAVQASIARAQTAAPPAPAPALAVSAGNDVIVLKGGGMLRGRLVEILPNDHATIALSTGQNAVVEWSRVERIEQQSAGYAPGQAAAPPPPQAVARVWVHVESDRPLTVEGLSPKGGWQRVCNSPCDAELPADIEYRIVGDGVRPSRGFRLEASPGQREIIDVRPGSQAGFTGGIVLVSLSGVAIFTGLLVAFVGALQNTTACPLENLDLQGAGGSSSTCNPNPGSGTVTAGLIITAAGAAGLVAGIILTAGNSKTSTKQEIAQPGGQARQDDDGAWLRLPMWHDRVGSDRSMPTPQLSPIFTHSF